MCKRSICANCGRSAGLAISLICSHCLQLSVLLSRADPVLHQRLKALQCADCLFAYRMLVVLLLRDLPTAQVRFPAQGLIMRQSCFMISSKHTAVLLLWGIHPWRMVQ